MHGPHQPWVRTPSCRHANAVGLRLHTLPKHHRCSNPFLGSLTHLPLSSNSAHPNPASTSHATDVVHAPAPRQWLAGKPSIGFLVSRDYAPLLLACHEMRSSSLALRPRLAEYALTSRVMTAVDCCDVVDPRSGPPVPRLPLAWVWRVSAHPLWAPPLFRPGRPGHPVGRGTRGGHPIWTRLGPCLHEGPLSCRSPGTLQDPAFARRKRG